MYLEMPNRVAFVTAACKGIGTPAARKLGLQVDGGWVRGSFE
jgi:hypothetical protein